MHFIGSCSLKPASDFFHGLALPTALIGLRNANQVIDLFQSDRMQYKANSADPHPSLHFNPISTDFNSIYSNNIFTGRWVTSMPFKVHQRTSTSLLE